MTIVQPASSHAADGPAPVDDDAHVVVVALRTRPFLATEPAAFVEPDRAGQQDGVGGLQLDPAPAGQRERGVTVDGLRTMVVRLPVKKWNGVQIHPKPFDVDHAFGPDSAGTDVYRALVEDKQMLKTVMDGGIGLILAYGQTGSGKTHTIQGLQQQIAAELFASASAFARAHFPHAAVPAEDVFKVEVEAFELLGKEAWDLLERGDGEGEERGRKVEIAEDKHEQIIISTSRHAVGSSSELLALLSRAAGARHTRSTAKNDVSSRSHALATVLVTNTLFPTAAPGRLVIVDLAGSERAADRKGNDKDRLEEGRLINESLMALKECVRARSTVDLERAKKAFVHIPYRGSKLTLALKPVFDLESTQHCKMIIIGHASPHPQDASHSHNTLSYCAPFRVVPTKLVDGNGSSKPSSWTHEQLKAWIGRESKKIDPDLLAPNGETGLMMTAVPEDEFVARCLSSGRPGMTLAKSAAKAFYLHLWKATVDAKINGRPHVLHGRLVARDPTAWTHFELLSFFDEEFPAVDGARAFPDPTRGKDVMEMGEATFVSRLMRAPRDANVAVTETLAQKVRKRLWSLRIEERTAGRDVIKQRRPRDLTQLG